MSHELNQNEAGEWSVALVGGAKSAWHGLGQTIEPGDSIETIARKGHVDWEALVVPSQYEFGGQMRIAPESFHMVRSDNGASLSVMSKRYKPVQPADVLGFFRDFVLTDERFSLETVGALKGGKVIWAMAKFAEPLAPMGEAHVPYVFLTTSYNGSLATTAQATMTRVVCNNTLTGAMMRGKDACIKVPHYRDFNRDSVKADAVERLASVIKSFDDYGAMAEALAGVRLAAHQVEGLFTRLTIDKAAKGDAAKEAGPSGKARNQLAALLESYRDTLAEGTKGGTAWAALNAVTRYVDHRMTVRDTCGDGKAATQMASALLGSGANLKREALAVLSEIGNLALAA